MKFPRHRRRQHEIFDTLGNIVFFRGASAVHRPFLSLGWPHGPSVSLLCVFLGLGLGHLR